jgi:glycine betaine/choline ABC-type transport system substrate-binding protein
MSLHTTCCGHTHTQDKTHKTIVLSQKVNDEEDVVIAVYGLILCSQNFTTARNLGAPSSSMSMQVLVGQVE